MKISKLIKKRALFAALTAFFAACGGNSFNYGKVRNILEGTPLRLDAEYVMLTPGEVDCGVQNELWDAPSDSGTPEHKFARLKQPGKDLGFSDDVSIGDMPHPHAQIRGNFKLAVNEINNDKAGSEPNTRLVTAKIGIVLQHQCFSDPLPLMGVRNGNFKQDIPPVLLFRFDNVWTVDQIVH